MKIIWIVYKRFDSDLSKTSREEMTRALIKQNHEVVLVTPYARNKPISELSKYIFFIPTLPFKGIYSLFFSITLFFYIGFRLVFNQPDTILFEHKGLWALSPFMFFKKLGFLKTNFCLDIRTVPVDISSRADILKEKMYEYSLKTAKYLVDGLTVITPLLKNQICRDYKFDENKIGIWSSGVTLDIFDEHVPDFKKITLFENKDLVLMYHGSLSPNRGIQNAIKAVSILKDQGLNIGFFIIGSGKAYGEINNIIHTQNLQ
ncbi:MAG: glycosyltransferase family 4 protein, partial [Candidatus Methanofastidiosa archaeon]|nr:glycosyltransferase family 4 protein [Candidatus Methanofastidiosa archaeon]